MTLQIKNLHKSFAGHVALDRIELEVGSAEFVCLLGPSGCGKTTLLRIVAGLMAADGGSVSLNGRDLAAVPARDRGFGIVFQSYSLFPHMTVAQNIGYGLRIRGQAAAETARRVAELLAVVKLPDAGQRYPGQLSGGQQQRVAIARALAVSPSLLLLDEPLSALDARVRASLRHELRALQRELGIPTLMVTHDQEEAMSMADTIVCMNQGRIEQQGPPQTLYLQPRTRFVADFMGHSNLLPPALAHRLAPRLPELPAGLSADQALLCVRPERIRLGGDAPAVWQVADTSFLGSIQRIRLHHDEVELLAETSSAVSLVPGQRVAPSFGAEDCSWVRA